MKAKAASKVEDENNPIKMLEEVFSSKANLFAFVVNPKNWQFLILSALALYGTYALFMQETLYHPFHVGQPTFLCFMATVGLWFGAISTLFQVTIQESINRFRALNKRLDEDVKKLAKEVDGLHATSEQLGTELEKFSEIRDQMSAYCSDAGMELNELFAQTTGVFDNMKKVQAEQERTLLEKIAVDIEFMDSSEGMSFKEFKRFCSRVPQQYRAMLKENQEQIFKEVAGDDDVISHDEMQKFFDKLIQDAQNPQAGA